MSIHLLVLTFTLLFFIHSEAKISPENVPANMSMTEFLEGQKCIPGYPYTVECNTCVCVLDRLSCTHLDCSVGDGIPLRSKKIHKSGKKGKDKNEKDANGKKKHSIKKDKDDSKNDKEVIKNLKDINRTLKDTNKQLYETNKKLTKSKKKAKGIGRNGDIDDLLDVNDQEFENLPRLEHQASECAPNKKYRVDCNVCYCRDDKVLQCDSLMCQDQEGTRKILVDSKSGKKCVGDKTTYISHAECISCECRNGLTACQIMDDCNSEQDKVFLSNRGPGAIKRLKFDYKTEECQPRAVYKEGCNKCYCSPDKYLRCTKKKCLNYKETVELEQKIEYLKARGL